MPKLALPNYNFQPATLKFLENSPKKLFINNEWVAPHSGKTFETLNPATGQPLAEIALADEHDVDA
ncbi:MAG TPA: hypothetical protein VLK33_00045, partial [Terriglobales bacterium]|nr:hypothetical protein [Terriglobales bacterium]